MSPYAQRIAIAKACDPVAFERHPMDSELIADGDGGWKPLPDYLADLNELHEAWHDCIAGNCELEDRFTVQLARCCGLEHEGDSPNLSAFDIATVSNASAPKRAEALLRTLSLWDDSK